MSLLLGYLASIKAKVFVIVVVVVLLLLGL